MGLFGWSYPPGCSGPPEEESFCQVCGKEVDDCICPECPVCGETGAENCYIEHALVKNNQQIESKRLAEEFWKKSADAEAEYPEINWEDDKEYPEVFGSHQFVD